MLPSYIEKCAPTPPSQRSAWYLNIAPAYAGVWLWVVFYQQIAQGTLDAAGIWWSLAALIIAAGLCYLLFYYVPGVLGMKTGLPLSVVGTSTFGTRGGYLMPGLLMGALQVGWVAVNTSVATSFILQAFNANSQPGPTPLANPAFTAIALAWCLLVTFVGISGIRYIARVSTYLNVVTFLMIAVVFFKTAPGLKHSSFAGNGSVFLGFTSMLQIVMGFFATAGAAGVDFCRNSRDARDVKWGGLIGVVLAAIYAGGLPLLSVAGAHGLDSRFSGTTYSAVIGLTGGLLARAMFLLFAVASVVPGCFSSFVASGSFSTMMPRLPRLATALAAAAVSIVLAVTGLAGNLVNVFLIVGASFAPICGAMTAEYLFSGKKWAGPRLGINHAGYLAWATGFAVGVIPFLPVSQAFKNATQPQVLYSWIAGFLVYSALSKAGLRPRTSTQHSALSSQLETTRGSDRIG